MRVFWGTIGAMALVLGAAGVVLPLLPTVPFVLLAVFCFARSSEKMHQWLLEHRVFGPGIDRWRQHGAISCRAKQLATASMIGLIGLSVLFDLPPGVLILQGLTAGAVLAFIWSRPTDPPKAGNKAHRADPGSGTE